MRTLICLGLLAGLAAAQGPGPLPPVPFPRENPFSPQKAVLGKMLYWEEQMASDDTVACGTCHAPRSGNADARLARNPGRDGQLNTPDDVFGSPGVASTDAAGLFQPAPVFGFAAQVTPRSAPNTGIAMYAPVLFWDGRASSTFVDPQSQQVLVLQGGALESQSVAPPVNTTEMAHAGRDWNQITQKLARVRPLALANALPPDVAAALQQSPTYPDLFRAAFGDAAITSGRVAFALATYERTLAPNRTALDLQQLTPGQQRGLGVFGGPGRCAQCHTGPFFTDNQFHNTGVRPIVEDNGRQAVTGLPLDAGRFKTAGLRNAGLKHRFQHNGGQASLEEVVDFYIRGGDFHQNQDPRIQPLNLGPQQRLDLIDFVRNALTDARAAQELAPFDRPVLGSEAVPPGSNVYGNGSGGTGGLVPAILAQVPATIGSADFKLGVANALGGAPAVLGLAARSASLAFGGLYMNIDPGTTLVLPFFTPLSGSGAGRGYGTFLLPVPDDPSLRGGEAFFQWFVADAAAAEGVSASPGGRVRLR